MSAPASIGNIRPTPICFNQVQGAAANYLHWKMNESSGDRVDAIQGVALTPVGTVTSTTGVIGNCAVLGPSGNLATIASPLVDLGNNFTICFWLNTAHDFSGGVTFFYKSIYIYNYYDVYFSCAFNSFYNTFNIPHATLSIPTSTWTHISCRVNTASQTITLGVDGSYQSDGTQTWSSVANDPTASLLVSPDNCPFLMDDLRVYKRVLSDAELATIRNGGAGTEAEL